MCAMAAESNPLPADAGILAGFAVVGPAGEIGVVESVRSCGDRPGVVVRGGVAGVRRLLVPAADVEAVDVLASEVRLRWMPAGAELWPQLRAAMGISRDEWHGRARAAIAGARGDRP